MNRKIMSNNKYKYPVGTRIKYIGCISQLPECDKDVGKTGKIVGYDSRGRPLIFLPESTYISIHSTKLMPVSWQCGWGSIKVLSEKNQQLLFDFAS